MKYKDGEAIQYACDRCGVWFEVSRDDMKVHLLDDGMIVCGGCRADIEEGADENIVICDDEILSTIRDSDDEVYDREYHA